MVLCGALYAIMQINELYRCEIVFKFKKKGKFFQPIKWYS